MPAAAKPDASSGAFSWVLGGVAMKSIRVIAAVMVAVLCAASAGYVSAGSIGRADMPSRVAQYFGYGYGAGHHAPIVRTPGQHPGHVPRNVRVPRSHGPLYPAPYRPIGCYGDACYAAPLPHAAPAPEAAPVPTAAPVEDRQAWRFYP